MNNITFTGVKNICYCIERTVDMNDFNNQERWMNIELTGHDLHKFRAALKRSCLPRKHYTNPLKDNFFLINIY